MKFKLTPEHCKENLETIITKIQDKDPTTAIVLQTMNAPWNPPEGKGFKDSETNRPEIEAFNENYRVVAKTLGLPLVDNYPIWLKLKETNLPRYQALVPDGSHPSKAGSQEVDLAEYQGAAGESVGLKDSAVKRQRIDVLSRAAPCRRRELVDSWRDPAESAGSPNGVSDPAQKASPSASGYSLVRLIPIHFRRPDLRVATRARNRFRKSAGSFASSVWLLSHPPLG